MKKIIYIFILFISIFSFSNKEIENIELKWKEFLLSVPQNISLSKLNEEDKEKLLKTVDDKAEKILDTADVFFSDEYVFNKYKNLKDGTQLRSTLLDIQSLAKAYYNPYSKFYKNEDVKEIIILGLEVVSEKGYVVGGKETGNWWHWEIGIPKTLNEVLVITRDILDEGIFNKLLEASKYYQPDPRYSGKSEGAKFSSAPNERISVGGNRTDTAFITFGRGILLRDENEIKEGINAATEVLNYTQSGDGIYTDGSFVQHGNVAYNGTYGYVLINGLTQLIYLSSNTKYEINNPNIEIIYKTLMDGYAYFLINGGINDSVNGRSISRDNSSDIERARIILSSLGLIQEGAGKYKEGLRSLIKYTVLSNNYDDTFDGINNLVMKNKLRDIVSDNTIKPIGAKGVKIFNNMDRAVQISENGSKFVISMHSNRIANYETMNNENLKGWYTGDGMTYIYTNDSSSFVEYWPVANMLKLPGTTESKNNRTVATGERRVKNKLSKKEFVGGATNGKYGIVAMDFSSHNDLGSALKSWILLGNEVIFLGSKINSSDGEINTIVDNRKINDSVKVTEKDNIIKLKDEKRNEQIVYVNLLDSKFKTNIENRKGSWKEIGGKLSNPINHKFVEITLEHGKNPTNEKYAYVVFSMFDDKEFSKYDVSNINILKLDEKTHVLKDNSKNLIAINNFEENLVEIEGFKFSKPISLLIQEDSLVVADPSQKQETFEIEIPEKLEVLENENVKLEGNKLIIKLKPKGESLIIKLKNR